MDRQPPTSVVQHQPNESGRPIFRPDAVRRYMEQQEMIVLPRRVAQRTIVVVWIALGVLSIAAAGIGMVRVPISVSGTAIIVDEGSTMEQGSTMEHQPALVAFLPPEARAQLAPGQPLLAQLAGDGSVSRHTITAVEPKNLSPAVARRRTAEPAAVVVASLLPTNDRRASDARHEQYPAKVVVDTRRLISFLPFFSGMFSEKPS